MKVVPGKMAEDMELMEKHIAITSRLGMPPFRVYRLVSGEGDVMHTVIYETEWDSLAAMEAFFDKLMADPEMQALTLQWDPVIESHGFEVYTPMP
mgnify:CR=1 FL=1